MMNGVQEWRTIDKSGWGDGPWQQEPDKVQWVDETTGLDCLIVRGPSGALCGYVGVPEGHPLHGVDYSACSIEVRGGVCPDRNPEESWQHCDHRPESRFEVHGGLTFAHGCTEPTPERFEQWGRNMQSCEAEAVRYPQGDSARRLRDLGHLRGDYEAWKANAVATYICHVPVDGRPDKVWWFGFDCAHSGDLSPQYSSEPRLARLMDGEYRDRQYVERECANLARQLQAVAAQ